MEISYSEAFGAKNAIESLQNRRLKKDLMIPFVRNKGKVMDIAQQYEEIHQKLVEQYTKTDDEGNTLWPKKRDENGNVVTEGGEPVEDRSGDPLFTDKQELVNELNETLADTQEVELEPMSLADFPDEVEPAVVDALSFMIEELDYDG
jgi:predicted lysophospholipase L1 biosynthesis ABC-type transport system permease subunit